MTDDDKAALIDRYAEAYAAYEGYPIPEAKKAMKKARKKLLAALESQADLERVKREAGAAALREAADAVEGLTRYETASATYLRVRADSIERDE